MRSAVPALDAVRVGVTASRRADDQIALLRRRGAEVLWAPVLRASLAHRPDESLRAATEQVLTERVDMLVVTTAIGVNLWLDAAASWGLEEPLLAHLAGAEILAPGPTTIGAVRARGLRELWSPDSEYFGDLLAHLAGRDLRGSRVVVQEFGRSLAAVIATLEGRGAHVRLVSSNRIEPAESAGGVRELVEAVAGRHLEAITFTAAPAITPSSTRPGGTGARTPSWRRCARTWWRSASARSPQPSSQHSASRRHGPNGLGSGHW